MLTSAAKLRSAKVSADLTRVYLIASHALDRPLWELREFFFGMIKDFNQASITLHTQPGAKIVLQPTLTLTLDDRVVSDYNAELQRATKRLRRRRWLG